MKRYITYLFCFLLTSGVLTSCETEDLSASFGEGGSNTLTLYLSTDGMVSRSTPNGVDAYNENRINTLDCFFYTSATGGALVHKSVTGRDYIGTGEHKIDISFTEDDLEALFGTDYKTNGNNKTCLIYVIANRPQNVTVTGSETIEALKKKTLTGSFTTAEAQTNFVMDSDGKDESDGNDVVTMYVANNVVSLSGRVPLYRSAAKVGLYVYVPKSIEVTNATEEGTTTTTWAPVAGSMKVKFHNGVSKGNIDYPYSIQNADYFVTGERTFGIATTPITEDGMTYSQTTAVPFYTYPTSTDKEKGTYFTLYLSWQNQTGGADTDDTSDDTYQYRNCSYQIPVNALEALERNNYYRLLLNVGVLGTENGVVELTPSYTVLEWNDETITADIKENVYLVVNEDYVEIHNKNQYAVSYTSSHDIQVQILSIKQPNFLEKKETTTTYYEFKDGGAVLDEVKAGTNGLYRDFSVDVVDNTVVLSHEIINKGEEKVAKQYDIAPYTVVVRVTMTFTNAEGEVNTYQEDITFKQYPAIYITADLNSDYEGGNSGTNGSNGYVYVNGYQKAPENGSDSNSFPFRYVEEDGQQFFGTANGLTSTGNSNPNMYTIHISSFSDNEYIIGDPRTMSYKSQFTNNYDNDGDDDGTQSVAENTNELTFDDGDKYVWYSAPALYEGTSNRRLKYYYPTDASDNTRNMIAPKIKVASSYSVVGNGFLYHKEAARRRCASYQEDGYPAGRWRLPTYAEAEYMVELSAEGKIPALFSTSARYWCAHGSFVPNNNGTVTPNSDDYNNNGSGHSVRCVYDEWYWGSEAPLTGNKTFTWGDYPRDAWPPASN